VNESRNTCGGACALTVLAPIREGRESSLTHLLSTLAAGPASPLASVAGTHFARWVVIGDMVYEGTSQRRPDHLKAGRLLFTSNFDGPLGPYLEELRNGLGAVADEIWRHCAGYPGSADARAFAAYMRSHQIESSLFFAAYGGRTVSEVQRSLATRRQVIDFAVRSQLMAPAELQADFREMFGG
jgi:hypothetical protein